ncbi:alanine racemase [Ectothiorhodospiraceae bacterium BW-2]|nr:alanine racemase [Ectothiorhodospiraceae bacterium BW-2]
MQRVVATISLAALRHNLQRVRAFAPGRRIWAVVKADGYGHGLLNVARGLTEADGFAVATLEEGLTLRHHYRERAILLLEGCHDDEELRQALAARLTPVVHQRHQLAALKRQAPATIWLKIDSGMGRLGFLPTEVASIYRQLTALPHVTLAGWMTHYANADASDHEGTAAQWRQFQQTIVAQHRVKGGAVVTSCANSAAVIAWPDYQGDWVRPGIMLYGISPMLGSEGSAHQLRPVMSLTAPLIAMKRLSAGATIGYGSSWRCERETTIGVVGIGYGDGYPRHAPSGSRVGFRGQSVALLGRVSMDMIVIDLTDCSAPNIGERVVLWGEGYPLERLANSCGTIGYELTCRLTPRVERRVIDEP